jgi:ATP-dependent helicase HrpB
MTSALPIEEALPAVTAALREGRNLVLQAPPGAGKSTRVPLELLAQPWAEGKRIILLEPRRLAARAVAQRMAFMLGESVGRTIGYRMRLDTLVSAETRLEVVTEGVLGAILRQDPALENVAAVLFDEFHERSLQADLGLALALDVQKHLNENLRIVVMSATLEAEPVATLLEDAAVVRSTGRSFPVDTRYVGRSGRRLAAIEPPHVIAGEVAAAVRRAVAEEEGDTLVFLPGAPEIRRVARLLEETSPGPEFEIHPLYGDLSKTEQDRALQPAPGGKRRLVIATNIAETSLTIQGVRIVIDSGLARRSRFDPVTGMSRLDTVAVSAASADQRRGRAGRLAPGVCYRLWTESVQRSLEAQTPAEILETDLAPLALELAGWNVTDPAALRWLDPPPSGSLAQARELLRDLGALDADRRITPHGRSMLELRIHPRLAHMLVRARELGLSTLAADVAALLGERDLLRSSPGQRDVDLRSRIEALRGSDPSESVDRFARDRVRRTARLIGSLAARSASKAPRGRTRTDFGPNDEPGVLVALAYPDRIARMREGAAARYVLSNGRGAILPEAQTLARSAFLAVAELDASDREARILLAAPISKSALEAAFAEEIVVAEAVRYDSREGAVLATRARRLGALTLEEKALPRIDSGQVVDALLEGIREKSLSVLPWTRETRTWQARVQFVRGLPSEKNVDWPDVSDDGLTATLRSWLAPWLDGMSRLDHLARLDLGVALESLLDWQKRQKLDALAPMHVEVPSGSRCRIDYGETDSPSVSVKLQEVFGLKATPRIGGGTVPLLMKLLSPAQRPVQITRDLESFWRNGYAEVRRELKGRYPRHDWPEDPLQARASRGVRRRAGRK